MRSLILAATVFAGTVAGGASIASANCCDVIPGVPPPAPVPAAYEMREAPVAFFTFPGPPPVTVTGELTPNGVFITDDPAAPRPPFRGDPISR